MMRPAHVIRISVQDLEPQSMRLVGIDPELSAGDLCLVIHAALGLEPAPPGRFTIGMGSEVAALDILDEPALDALFSVDDFATYHPSTGSWEIRLLALSEGELPHKTPALIDATGPDLVSALGDARAQAGMLEDVRQISAGLPIPAPQLAEILALFPNYTAEQVRQRLTRCFEPVIVDRLGELASTDLEETLDADGPEAPPELAGLAGIAGISGIEGNIAEVLPELFAGHPLPEFTAEQADELGRVLGGVLLAIAENPKLTSRGNFKPKLVKRLAQQLDVGRYWLGGTSREDTCEPISVLHATLLDAGLIAEYGTTAQLTPAAQAVIADPQSVRAVLSEYLPVVFEQEDLLTLSVIFAMLLHEDPTVGDFIRLFAGEAWYLNQQFFLILGVLEPEPLQTRLTPTGRGLVGDLLGQLRAVLDL